MEVTLDRNSNSVDHEILDVPITQTVEDSQLGMSDTGAPAMLKKDNKVKSTLIRDIRKMGSAELVDSHHLTLPKSKAVSFIDKNHMILESIEESPGSRP